MKYGKAIRIVRAARGMTGQELACRAGVDASYISLLERDRRVPSAEALRAISDALAVPGSLLTLLGSADKTNGASAVELKELGEGLLMLLTDSK